MAHAKAGKELDEFLQQEEDRAVQWGPEQEEINALVRQARQARKGFPLWEVREPRWAKPGHRSRELADELCEQLCGEK